MASDIISLSRVGTTPVTVVPPTSQTQRPPGDDSVGGLTQAAVTGVGRDESARNDDPMRSGLGTATASRETERAGASERVDRNRADPNGVNANDRTMREKLEQAIDKLNKMMGGRSSLNFQIDEEYDKLVIRVVDTDTDEVIRQIPSKETLKFAEYVEGLAGLILNDKA